MKNKEKLKEKIKDSIKLEKDEKHLCINISIQQEAREDENISKIIMQGENLLEETLKSFIREESKSIAYIEHIEHEDYVQLKFEDKEVMGIIYELFYEFFYGD